MTETNTAPASVRLWLLACVFLVVCMVAIGGVTRLTESGLSIVEWKLFSGVFPPLSEKGWAREFAAYQTSPEYQKKNFHFGIAEFKQIFWLEYLHRLLGRVTGLVIVLPYLWFLVRRQLPPPLPARMAVACLLVAAQGAVGWVMVASGLVDDPRVNPLKLAAHLGLALALFSLLLMTYWGSPATCHARVGGHPAQYSQKDWIPAFAGMTRYGLAARAFLFLLAVQILLGALVAGNDAGLSYNTYPLMDGRWIPEGLRFSGWVSDVLTVQFLHRMGAHLVVLAALAMMVWGWREVALRRVLALLGIVVAVQFTLGVLTLVNAVPLVLASLHQLVAVALLAVALALVRTTRRGA